MNATMAEVIPARKFLRPVRRPRFDTGMTFDIRKLNITPCMPWNNPNRVSQTKMATRAWSGGSYSTP